MRSTLISMLAVLLLAVGICLVSVTLTGRITDEIEDMRAGVLRLTEEGNMEEAHALLGRMAEEWEARERLLEVLAPHESLHEITCLIIESEANLTAGDPDDFNRSMSLMGEALHHLYLEELPRLTNIL